MIKRPRLLAHAAIIAALYAVLTHFQNLLLPGSATWAIQFRASEALCVLAFFTPAAIPGLAVGCFLFNLTYSGALPLDMLVGTAATALACGGMYLTRRTPFVGLLLPAVFLPVAAHAEFVPAKETLDIIQPVLLLLVTGTAVLISTIFFYTVRKKRKGKSNVYSHPNP